MISLVLLVTSFFNWKKFHGVIQTCSGWRLNRYPVLKKFIKEDGGINIYDSLKVSFVTGHNPDLLITKPLKRIDLTTYKNEEDLHELLLSYNFKIKDDSIRQKMCKKWYVQSFCTKYVSYMNQECSNDCKK